MEIHWYCLCGTTRQVMDEAVAEMVVPTFTCQTGCGSLVGPVYESEELIRHQVEGEGC